MGKRSDFARNARDFYPTPYEAVAPLLPHLHPGAFFIEPCCGEGDLVSHLINAGREYECAHRSDIEMDARTTQYDLSLDPDYFVTNPPWSRPLLHDIIVNLSDQLPTWLLLDADWMHTKQSIPYLNRLCSIVSVGRVKWIPNSKMTGKDNAAWYLFDEPWDGPEPITTFHGRQP